MAKKSLKALLDLDSHLENGCLKSGIEDSGSCQLELKIALI